MAAGNPFAPPAEAPDEPAPAAGGWATGVWRDGGLVVARAGASLPAGCPVCAAPVEGPEHRLELVGSPRWTLLGLLLGPMGFAVARWAWRTRAVVGVCLCPEHQAGAARARLVEDGLLAGGVLGSLLSMTVFPLAVLPGFGCALLAVAYRSGFRAVIVSGDRLVLGGCSDAWIARLPALPRDVRFSDVPDLED